MKKEDIREYEKYKKDNKTNLYIGICYLIGCLTIIGIIVIGVIDSGYAVLSILPFPIFLIIYGIYYLKEYRKCDNEIEVSLKFCLLNDFIEESEVEYPCEYISSQIVKGLLQKNKVIFNPPATILIKDGKKYVSIAKDEPYDKEKGLALCLLKSKGVSYSELRKMMEKGDKK